MDDDGGLLGVLFFFLVLTGIGLLLLLIWVLWRYAEDNPEEMKRLCQLGLLAVTSPLWFPAWLVLYVVRNMAVYEWPELRSYLKVKERDMVVLWTVVVPVLAVVALTGCIILFPVDSSYFGYGLLIFTSNLVCYFYLYFNRPPFHHNWPLFLAAEEQLRFDARASVRLHRYEFRLWLAGKWQEIQQYLKQGSEDGGTNVG